MFIVYAYYYILLYCDEYSHNLSKLRNLSRKIYLIDNCHKIKKKKSTSNLESMLMYLRKKIILSNNL